MTEFSAGGTCPASWMMQGLAAGQVFAEDFQIVRPLGKGGMGSVFLAVQLSTGRKRALKLLQALWLMDPRMRERFALEARAASNLESDHVVDVVAAGIDQPSGVPWLAMEYLEGETLASRVQRSGRLAPAELAEILRQLGHGLNVAHQAGLVHRDIKPANIFVADPRREGVPFTVKLLDFGIVKFTQAVGAHDGTSAPIGSPGWMAPEQFENHTATVATDIWSLGLVAYYCLVGRSYWQSAELAGLVREILADRYPAASSRAAEHHITLPRGFDDWFACCSARQPTARFPSVVAALSALRPLLVGPEGAQALQQPAGATLGGATLPAPASPHQSVPGGYEPGAAAYGLHGRDMTLPTQPPTQPRSLAPPTASAPYPTLETSGSTFSPLANPSGSLPSEPRASGRGWVWLVAAALVGVVLLGVSALGAALYYRPWETAAVVSPKGPAVSPSTLVASADGADGPPIYSPEATPAAQPEPAPRKAPALPTAAPTGAPNAPSAAPSSEPAAEPSGAPTPAAAAGFRSLIQGCWLNNEGATAEAGANVSATVRIDASGYVRAVQVSGSDAFPNLRRCIVRQGTDYRGFQPATFTVTTLSVSLKPKPKPAPPTPSAP